VSVIYKCDNCGKEESARRAACGYRWLSPWQERRSLEENYVIAGGERFDYCCANCGDAIAHREGVPCPTLTPS
jgi:predicted RNA-binding Zn-ribbon protein involved in translation (DUF1610 family)